MRKLCKIIVKSLDPTEAAYQYNKGLVLYELKRSNAIIEACDKAIELDPHCSYAYYYKGLKRSI